jgi:hypothetical protein
MFDQLIHEHYERAAQYPAGGFDLDSVVDLERVDEADVTRYVRDVVTRVLRPLGGEVRTDQDLFMQGGDRHVAASPPRPVCRQPSNLCFILA